MVSSCAAMLTLKTIEKNAAAQSTTEKKPHPSNLSSHIYTQPMQGVKVGIQLLVMPEVAADGAPLAVQLLASFSPILPLWSP